MFRTELHPSPFTRRISLTHPLLTLGSCFSENIGKRLDENKFTVLVSPFGTVYNPVSIFHLITLALDNRQPDEEGYGQRDDVYFHYDFHSSFSSLDQHTLHQSLQQTIALTHQFLKATRWIILTFGTAWVYVHQATGKVVANCHKMPGHLFHKELLSQKKIIGSFNDLYTKLHALNPGVEIILTVSPVRHLRDTLEGNSISKSVLRIVCHTLSITYPHVHYFPAYELLLDDLRDYRFYASDLIHPSEEALEYIWQKFIATCMDEQAQSFITEWTSIRQALAHRPFLPGSQAHKTFVLNTLQRLEKLSSIVNVRPEMEALQKQLT
jgi:hypothetical protein